MKHRQPSLVPAVGLALVTSCVLATAAGAAMRFEPTPRAVLAAAGVHETRAAQMAFATNGRAFLLAAVGAAGRLEMRESHDGGGAFGAPVAVTPPEMTVAASGEQTPQFFLDLGRNAFAVLFQGNAGTTKDLYVTTKPLFGAAPFGPPVRVTDSAPSAAKGFASFGLAPNGDYAVAWLDGRTGHAMAMPMQGKQAEMTGTTFDVEFARSSDGGKTFGANVAIASVACPCCRPALAFGPEHTVYAAWRGVFPGDIRDVVVAVSHDDGATWSAPVRVNKDGWSIRGCPDSGPTLTTDEHGLVVAWFTLGRNGVPQIRAARSVDGRVFGPATVVSPHIDDANHVHAVPGAAVPTFVFEGRDPSGGGWGTTRAYVVQERGSVWTTPVAVPGGKLGMQNPIGVMRDPSSIFIVGDAATVAETNVVLVRGRL